MNALWHTGQAFRTKQENFVFSVSGLYSLDDLFQDDTIHEDIAHLLDGPCYCTIKSHTSMDHPNRGDANSVAEVCSTHVWCCADACVVWCRQLITVLQLKPTQSSQGDQHLHQPLTQENQGNQEVPNGACYRKGLAPWPLITMDQVSHHSRSRGSSFLGPKSTT